MTDLYEITPGISVHRLKTGEGAFIFDEVRRQFTDARILVEVLSKIETGKTLSQLVDLSSPSLSAAEVIFALNQLQKDGIVRFGSPVSHTASPGPVISHGIRLAGPDTVGLSALTKALSRAFDQQGMVWPNAATESSPERISVVLLSDFLGTEAVTALSAAEARGMPYLSAKLTGERALIGPRFGVTGKSAREDWRSALLLNRPLEAWLTEYEGRAPGLPSTGRVGLGGETAAGDLADRLVQLVSGAPLKQLFPDDAMQEWNGQDRSGYVHLIHSLTDGPTAQIARHDPPKINPTLQLHHRDGGYRLLDAETVIAKLLPFVSDLTGRISDAGPLNVPDPNRHVHAAVYPVLPRVERPDKDAFHGVALGKGRTDQQARASALCEAVERISAQYRGDAVECVASPAELGDGAVAPNRITNFSAAQYDNRDKWNTRTLDTRRHIPAPVSSDQRMSWVRAWSLTKSRWRWLPRDHCFANAPPPNHSRFDPNGCAAGGCIEDAILQGFLELVERDCVAIWWGNRLQRPGFSAEEIRDPVVRSLAEGIMKQGWEMWCLDLTNDLGIPCVTALARSQTDTRWCTGFGAHFSAEIAVERAVTELAQLFRTDGRDGAAPWAAPPDGDERYLNAHGTATIKDAPTKHMNTFAELIDWSTEKLDTAGLEMIILDQTDPQIGLPVVKVTVPGLRHFWPRFGPGRLYDVPVSMGWRETPCREEDLNPVPLFL